MTKILDYFTTGFLYSYILLLSSQVDAYRILCLFPHIAKSHFVMGEALMKGLIARGHQIVVVSHFPQTNPHTNYTDISLVGSAETAVENTPLQNVGTGNVMFTINMLSEMAIETCEKTLSYPPIQKLIQSNEKFDLIITELFNSDCMLGFVHKFKVPFISIATSVLMPWARTRFANPDNPSYIPNHFLAHSDRMTFSERFINFIYQEALQWAYYFTMDMPTQEIARKYFGKSLPPLADISKNTSLLLVNSHFSINQPRPLVPNIVEVGGLHLTPPKELPKDLKLFLDESKHGVIYFSLGSIVKTDTLPLKKRNAFLQAFSELPQRVIWKWESDTMPGKPENVKLVKWLPQIDVLRHPNIKVFVTHGGLMGTTEAIHNGVPMVGIPLFGDQEVNIQSYVSEGFAIKLLFTNITKESVLEALKTIIFVPSYRENAKRISEAFNDRLVSPLDTAVYWTEYVVRHGGAQHLRSAALDLTWYQYLLLDVIAVLVTVVLIILFTFLHLTKFIIRKLKPLAISEKKSKQQ